MTNEELIAKIKAEIDKRYAEYREKMKSDDFTYYEGMADALDLFEQFIDTIESEKPMNLEKMEREEELKKAVHQVSEEIVKEIFPDDLENGDFFTEIDLKNCITRVAYQFAEWGAEHAKIDVTDFCKPIDPGIAQCIADHSWEMLGEDEKPVPNDLEEAAWDCVLDSIDVNNPVLLPKYKELLTYLFIAGAKWYKNALLEWAKERYNQTISNVGCYTGHSVWEEVIEKLESL